MRRTLCIPSLFVVFLAVGCGEGSPPPPTHTVRDSAGFTIVENTGEAWGEGEAWTLTGAPILSIGVVEGATEYQFQDVRGATRLPDGTVVVADRGAQHLRWYDSVGQYLSTAGGRGGGPGEFEGLLWLFRRGDTVAVHDERLRRMSYFSPAGAFVRSVQIEPASGLVYGLFSDGSTLLGGARYGELELREGYMRPVRATYRLDADGGLLDTLPRFPGREEVLQVMNRSGARMGVGLMPPPFGRETVFAVGDSRFAVGTQNESEIEIRSPHGALEDLLRWSGEDRLVSDEVVSRHQAYWLGRAGDDEARRRTQDWLGEQVYPDSLPAHGDILFDSMGDLWIESYQLRGQGPVPWRVFDSDFRLLGTVLVPDRFNVFEIGEDYVLGRWWDELDVEHVQLYGLHKPGG